MFTRIRLSSEQEKQLDDLLTKKLGNSRVVMTGEEYRLLKATLSQDIEKSEKLTATAVKKALDTLRDTLPKLK